MYSQSAYHMPRSTIYCSLSFLPVLHLIIVSWGHVSQKYSPLYSVLFCRENNLENKFVNVFYSHNIPLSYKFLFPSFYAAVIQSSIG